MKLELSQRVGVNMDQRLQLDEADRRVLEAAAVFWETKPHAAFSVPVATVMAIFAGGAEMSKRPNAVSEEPVIKGSDWQENFVFLTKAEMRQVGQGEKYGLLLGECIFISETVPEEYVPLVVLNLAAYRRAKDDSALARFMARFGVDTNRSQHFTGVLTDILAAQYHFQASPEKLQHYLRWRKEIERTDFFVNPAIEKLLARRVASSRRGRTLHPTQRSRYSRRSFQLVAAAESCLTRAQVDTVITAVGVTKADIIIGRITGEASFDPNAMVETIDAIVTQLAEQNKLPPVQRNKPVTLSISQSVQAYLLTEDVVGVGAVLQNTNNPNAFQVTRAYMGSFAAIKDRVLYLSKQALKKTVPDRGVLRSLQNLILTDSAYLPVLSPINTEVPQDEESGNRGLAHSQEEQATLLRKIAEIEALLSQHDEVVRTFAAMNASNAIPMVLVHEREKLVTYLAEVRGHLQKLDQVRHALDALATVHTRTRALMSQVNFPDDVS